MAKRGPDPKDIPGLDIFVRGIVDWMRDGRPGGIKISQAINEFAAANGCSAALVWKRVEEAELKSASPTPEIGARHGRTPTFKYLVRHLDWLEANSAKHPDRQKVEQQAQLLRQRMADHDGNPGWLTWIKPKGFTWKL